MNGRLVRTSRLTREASTRYCALPSLFSRPQSVSDQSPQVVSTLSTVVYRKYPIDSSSFKYNTCPSKAAISHSFKFVIVYRILGFKSSCILLERLEAMVQAFLHITWETGSNGFKCSCIFLERLKSRWRRSHNVLINYAAKTTCCFKGTEFMDISSVHSSKMH